MNTFDVITKYAAGVVDEYFVAKSKTAILENGNKFIDLSFKETGYVKIADILLDGLSNYYRAQEGSGDSYHASYAGNLGTGLRDGFGIGGAQLTWEIYKLRYVRGKQFRIDYISNEETAYTFLGNAFRLFIEQKVIPEVDELRFATIADQTSVSLGNRVIEAAPIAANTIISKFNEVFQWFSEHEVPEEEQIIFASPEVMKLIRQTNELTKFLTQENYRNGNGVDFTIQKYGLRPIIEVPPSRFFTNCYVDPNNGYRAVIGSSKLINFMVVSARAIVPIRKLEWSQIFGPELSGLVGFHGYIMNYLIYHDTIVPKNKIIGCYVNIDGATTVTAKVDTLSIDTRAGKTTNGWILNNFFTNPAALRGRIVYADTAFTLGADLTGTEGTDYFSIVRGEEKVDAVATSHYFALVDDRNKIIAVSGQVTLEKKI